MSKRPVNEFIQLSLGNVNDLIDCSKIMGKPLFVDENKVIIPIAKLSFGFGTGGTEFDSKGSKKNVKNDILFEASEDLYPFGGGSLGGVSIQPEAFMIIENGKSKLIKMDKDPTIFDRLLDLAKNIINETKKDESE